MTTLFLTRHGQTLWNSELRYQGQMDTDLSPLGLAQAERLAERLRAEPLAAVYTSDLRRSFTTARIVAQPHDLSPVPMRELREAHYGEWQGLTYAEVRERYPEMVIARRRDAVGFTPPAGESLGATGKRVLAAVSELAVRHPEDTVLIVTHGGPLRMFISMLLAMPSTHAFRLRLDNCGLTIIETFPKSPTLTLLNETCYLRELTTSGNPALGN